MATEINWKGLAAKLARELEDATNRIEAMGNTAYFAGDKVLADACEDYVYGTRPLLKKVEKLLEK